jgi:hypothetical protein
MRKKEARHTNTNSAKNTLSDGRRGLINSAIYECITIINLIRRFEYVSKSEIISNYSEADSRRFKDFLDNHPQKQPGILKTSQIFEYKKLFPSDVLEPAELSLSQSYLKSLALVIFCQIFHSGYGDDKYTRKNDRNKNRSEMNKIIQEGLSREHADNFSAFVDRALQLRDTMIAHADGKAFQYKVVNPAVASHRMMIAAVDEIDIDEFSSYLDAIRVGYANTYRSSTDTD